MFPCVAAGIVDEIEGTPPLLVTSTPLFAVARPTTVVPAALYQASWLIDAAVTVPPPPPVVHVPPASIKLPLASICTQCPFVSVPVAVAKVVVFPERVPCATALVPLPMSGKLAASVVSPVPPFATPSVPVMVEAGIDGRSAATSARNVGVPVEPFGAAKTVFVVSVASVTPSVPAPVIGEPETAIIDGTVMATDVTVPPPVRDIQPRTPPLLYNPNPLVQVPVIGLPMVRPTAAPFLK